MNRATMGESGQSASRYPARRALRAAAVQPGLDAEQIRPRDLGDLRSLAGRSKLRLGRELLLHGTEQVAKNAAQCLGLGVEAISASPEVKPRVGQLNSVAW